MQVGRPRPDFMSRCWPSGGEPTWAPSGLPLCEEGVPHQVLKTGMRSFPSGGQSSAQGLPWVFAQSPLPCVGPQRPCSAGDKYGAVCYGPDPQCTLASSCRGAGQPCTSARALQLVSHMHTVGHDAHLPFHGPQCTLPGPPPAWATCHCGSLAACAVLLAWGPPQLSWPW